MKILLVSNYYPEHSGGIETAAFNLVRRYREAGHEVRWIAADIPHCPHASHPDDVPIRVWNFTEKRLGFPCPIPLPSMLGRMREEVRRCDVIHLHDCIYPASVLTFAWSRRARKPVLLTQHVKELPYEQGYKRALQGFAYRSMGRWLLSRAEQVVFYSLTVQGHFGQFVRFASPPRFIANGVDTDLFRPGDENPAALRESLGMKRDGPILLFVGRFVAKKGISLLRPIIEKRSDWSWIFVGRPAGEDPAGWRMANLKVIPAVPQEQLRNYYAAADLLVLPSVGEGFPLSAQESMACGTPALLGEETLCALPGGHDLFLAARPDPEIIEQILERAMSNPDKLRDLRSRCRAFACEQWSWANSSGQYLKLLTELTARKA